MEFDFGLLWLLFAVTFFGVVCGIHIEESNWHREAIQAHAGFYSVNPETGFTTFKWGKP
jgi:hypothetical protein